MGVTDGNRFGKPEESFGEWEQRCAKGVIKSESRKLEYVEFEFGELLIERNFELNLGFLVSRELCCFGDFDNLCKSFRVRG